MLKLEEVYKSFGNPAGTDLQQVLRGVGLDLGEGETIAILGPSGSGKSTLLNIIGALDQPDRGEVFFKGRKINGYSEKELDRFRNEEIGFVFQFHHLLPQCNLLENVLLPTLVGKANREEKKAYAESLLNRTGLGEHHNKLPGQLSGGECQRTAVIRAMINRPRLLLADEPTGALDGKNVDVLTNLLMELNREENVAIILVTHSRELAARMGKIFELKDGVLHQQ